MRKYILLLGVFCLGLVSCMKEDVPQQDGMVTFSASYNDAPATKTVLEGMKPYWTPSDKISVYDGKNNEFVNTASANSATTKFKGVLNGKGRTHYFAAYPYNESLEFSFMGMTVYNLTIPQEQTAVENTYDPKALVAIAYTKDKSFAFKNMCSLVKFTIVSDGVTSVKLMPAGETDVLAGVFNATILEGDPRFTLKQKYSTVSLTGDFKKGSTYYIVTYPTSLQDGMSVVLNNSVISMVVDTPVALARSGMVNLGSLSLNPSESQKPTNPDEGEDDAVASAWGLLGAHNGWNTAEPTPMYEIGSNFVAFDVPAEVAGGFKFKNGDTWVGTASAVSVDAWVNAQDGDAGQNIAFTGTATAYDIYFATSLKAFYITAAGNPAPEALPKPFSGMTVAGTFNGWATAANPTEAEGDYYVLKGIKAAMVNSADATGGDKGFKFVYTEEDGAQTWYGAPSASVSASKWYNINSDGSSPNIFVGGDASADYDVYITKDRKSFCVVPAGEQLPSQGEQGGSEGGDDSGNQGGSGNVEMSDKVIYLNPWEWSTDNPVISAYFIGGSAGDQWVSMTQDGNYLKCNVPVGYTSVIFVRLNPAGAANNWDSKWNQTVDLTIPSDMNLFTINSWDGGAEGKSTGAWSNYTAGSVIPTPEPDPTPDPTPEPDPTPGEGEGTESVRIYLSTAWGWPYIWCWDAAGAQIFAGASWPGTKYHGEENGYYYWDVPEAYVGKTVSLLAVKGDQSEKTSDFNDVVLDKSVYFYLDWNSEDGCHLIQESK